MSGPQAPILWWDWNKSNNKLTFNLNNCKWDQSKLTLGNLQGKGACLMSPQYHLESSPMQANSRLAVEYISKLLRLPGLLALMAKPSVHLLNCALEESPLLCVLVHVSQRCSSVVVERAGTTYTRFQVSPCMVSSPIPCWWGQASWAPPQQELQP